MTERNAETLERRVALGDQLAEIGKAIAREGREGKAGSRLFAQRLRTARRLIDAAMPKAPARD